MDMLGKPHFRQIVLDHYQVQGGIKYRLSDYNDYAFVAIRSGIF